MKIDLINTKQAAELLRVHRQRVLDFVHESRLIPYYRPASGFLFLRSDVLRFKKIKRPNGRPKNV